MLKIKDQIKTISTNIKNAISFLTKQDITIIHPSGTMIKFNSDGSLDLNLVGELRIHSNDNIWINGENINLNCDRSRKNISNIFDYEDFIHEKTSCCSDNISHQEDNEYGVKFGCNPTRWLDYESHDEKVVDKSEET